MLPYVSGEEICKYIRSKSEVPIIMLTAKIEDEDKIDGFHLGCDDYICKPFNISELILRVKAVLKRCNITSYDNEIIKYGEELEVNTSTYEVKVKGKEVILTNTEYKILLTLINNPKKIYSRENLLESTIEGYYEKGEFCISGPTVMKCYYNDEEETKKTLRKHSDGKIWLHTGDMGYMDESGLLYYTDRLTRMYTSGGFNVYPPHIEEVILKLDEIESCAVVPMKHPSKNIKVPKVYIIMKKGYEFNEDLLNKIKNICSLNLDLYHQPFSIESIDSFPITNLGENIGKVDYKKLEENANETVKVKKLVK